MKLRASIFNLKKFLLAAGTLGLLMIFLNVSYIKSWITGPYTAVDRNVTYVYTEMSLESKPSIQFYNVTAPVREIKDYFLCLNTTTKPSTVICVYDPNTTDIFISRSLIMKGIWESTHLALFQKALNAYPNSLVLDAGANIGMYSLLAAKMGYDVISVEPMIGNMIRLHRAAHMSGTQAKITAIKGALSDARAILSFEYKSGNQGATRLVRLSNLPPEEKLLEDKEVVVTSITMDDLLYVPAMINRKTAIIKMDIEGSECKALASSSKFFGAVFIPYIFMEWIYMEIYKKSDNATCNTNDMQVLSDYLASKGFTPYSLQHRTRLDAKFASTRWTSVLDVVWIHAEAKMLW